MAALKGGATLRIWPNKDAEAENHFFAAGTQFDVVEDWDTVLLVRDGEGRVLQVARALLDL